MENTDQLRRVQLLELKIAEELKRICQKNHIKYFIMWGSLLGAVRHKGFIPWDDDMDFGMLRKDYEKFIDACKKELDPNFFLQTWDTDPDFPFAYAKMRLKGTHFLEKFSEGSRMNNGIFIDIFPMDNVPDSGFKNRLRVFMCFMCERLMWLKKGMGKNIKEDSLCGRIKYNIFNLISKLVSYEGLKKHYVKTLCRYNSKKTKNIETTSVNCLFGKNGFCKNWTEEIEEVPFETTTFPAFKNNKEFLTLTYGDYMTLPPIEERQGHLPTEIDFGPY